ncbi:MAG: mannose-1-phosphate guanylyltransferase/mannose-6-phosphate isomerase [Syntrophobacteraceae bacterium]|nr:mannose-1-phosphate guanylyltransferase/mannose-6-phosphate isomerase [Desulfobacteraceae bacterium]
MKEELETGKANGDGGGTGTPIVPVILAGGSGSGLWPLSRELYPKQLLPLRGELTLLQEAGLRAKGVRDAGDPIVVCSESHRFLVAEQLRSIGFCNGSILLEPFGRNTAPAVALSALRARKRGGDPILLVMPADHHISPVERFHRAMEEGGRHAEKGRLVMFGVVPESPETGYGYILKGEKEPGCADSFGVEGFWEKPESDAARGYVESGRCYWNSGIFMFKASRFLEELDRFAPGVVSACALAVDKGIGDLDFFRVDAEAFDPCPCVSLDCALMEKSRDAVVVEMKAEWGDLDSWRGLWKVGSSGDSRQNVQVGDVLAHDVSGCYLHSTGRLIAAVGLRDHVVVETSDAVLVSPWNRVQEVRVLVDELKAKKREEALSHRKVYRPWGSYECINLEKRFQVKRITVKPGGVLSLQMHHHRAEHWVVVHGTALVTKGDESFLLKEDQSTYIPLGVNHRLENPGKIPLEIIEVQSGSYLGEDDIVRFEDVYGRQR